MTLAQLTNLVCLKCHRTDDQSRTEAQAYIKARYEMMWDSRLWRDSLGLLTVTAPATQTIIMPALAARVVSARWGDVTTLQNEQLGTMFYLDPAKFDTIGQPASFSIIAPSAVEVAPGGQKLSLFSSDDNAAYTVTVRGLLGNTDQTERVTLSGQSSIPTTNDYDQILSLSKDSEEYDLFVENEDGDTLLSLETWETSRAHQRLHFHSTPDASDSLLILYKRKLKPLVNDSDATEISGIDNALLSASIADMLEGQRQYAKAQLKAGEASSLAKTAVDLEQNQSANIIRMVPWDSGFGEGDVSTKGYW